MATSRPRPASARSTDHVPGPAEARDTRGRIVEVAAEQFYRHGFGVVGVQDLCALAGVSKSSLYHFFPAKEDLALAVLDWRWAGFTAMVEPMATAGVPPLARLRGVFGAMHGISTQTHAAFGAVRGCPFGSLGSELSDAVEPVRLRVAQIFDAMAALFRGWLGEAVAAGELSAQADLDAMAADLVAAVQAVSVIGRVYNDPQRVKNTGERLLAGILGTACAKSRRPAPREKT